MSVEKIREEYDVVTIPLSATMTDVPFYFDANTLIVAQVPIAVNMRINDVSNKSMNLQIFRRFDMKIAVVYLTTTTISTTDLILFASKTVSVLTGGFAGQAVLVDSVATEYDARDVMQAVVLANSDEVNDGAEEASGEIDTTGYNKLTGFIVADQVLTIDIYCYYVTGGTAYLVDEITTVANVPLAFEIPVVCPIMEIRFDNNSGTNTTTCEKSLSLSTGT